MTSVTFDTLSYSKQLEKSGFTREQAEGMALANAEAFRAIADEQLATKADIEIVKREIAEAKHEILKWMATAMIAQTALLVGIIAFLR